MLVTMFGIPNCSTVKKARDWLDQNQISYEFHDFKKQGISEEMIHEWLKHVSLDELINRSGMTYRKLSDEQKSQSNDLPKAIELMINQPSIVKRPILAIQQQLLLGFKETQYQLLLKNK